MESNPEIIAKRTTRSGCADSSVSRERVVPVQDYTYVRCLFCLTGYEDELVKRIEADQLGKALFPKKVKRLKQQGSWEEIVQPLFPGYVFIYSDEPYPMSVFFRYEQVIRVLKYADDGSGYLKAGDLRFAAWIWRQNGRLEALKALRVGDRVEIVDGAFRNMNGRVLKMDKRKQAAKIELDVIGGIKQVWMSFVYLEEAKVQVPEDVALNGSIDSING